MTTTEPPVVRFAPSPTGHLHIGNMRTALYNWLIAKGQGGTFILRLDDTDQARSTDAFAEQIGVDLEWMGILPDRTEKQSDRLDAYDDAVRMLKSSGQLYPCYETPDEIERRRKRLMARGLPPVYDRAALRMTADEKAAFEAEGRKPHWRFLLPNFDDDPYSPRRTEVHFDDLFRGEQTVDLSSMSDPVLIRGDGTYLYTLPSVVDDRDMGVTHVIRGADHITNTGAQIAIFEALGAKVPAFGHHNLLKSSDGEGLSKRSGALSVKNLRDEGHEALAVASLAVLTGTSSPVEPVTALDALGSLFSPGIVSKSEARFSMDELHSLNERVLHAYDYDDVRPRLVDIDADLGRDFWTTVQRNLKMFRDVEEWRDIVQREESFDASDSDDADYLASANALLPDEPWDVTTWTEWTGRLKAETGRKGRVLFMPLRKALTGRDNGPEMADLLPIIGRERTSRRLP